MYGIVTIVEGEQAEMIRGQWAAFAREHGPGSVKGQNIPHMSYHVAEAYDLRTVSAVLTRLASTTDPFSVRTSGLGFISAPYIVTWINLTRTPALSHLHQRLWDEAGQAGSGIVRRYHPDRWFPHVTLSDTPVLLGEAQRLSHTLMEGDRFRAIPVSNLAVIEETESGHGVRFHVNVGAMDTGA